MNILFTLDRNYLQPLRVLLVSLFINNPSAGLHLYLAGDGLTQEDWDDLAALCAHHGAALHPVAIDERWFDGAPTLRYYSRAMYYRLLAAQMLPETLDRILYLDPDMLVIGPLDALYETDMGGMLYGACIHKGLIDLSTPVNRLRLDTPDAEGYFNSGMLLMNLPEIRKSVRPQDVFDYVEKNKNLLVLPDQDVLNGLCSERILPLDELLYNYDARHFSDYLLATQGEADTAWVMENTRILHFCGKRKPWHRRYVGRFGMLYRHYMQLTARSCALHQAAPRPCAKALNTAEKGL